MLKRVVYLIPLIAGLVVAAIVFFGYGADRDNHVEKSRAEVLHVMTDVAARLENALDAKLHLITALRSSIQANPDMQPELFQTLARRLLVHEGSVRSVWLARDNVVTHVYPAIDADHAMGRQLFSSGPVQARGLAMRAQGTGAVQILVPDQDNKSIVDIMFFAPVLVTSSDGESRYWGQVVICLDLRSFYSRVGLFDTLHGILLALRKPEVPPSKEMILAGSAIVFDMVPLIQTISVPAGVWELAAVPQGGWSSSPLKVYILVGGGIGILLVPASLWAVLVMILGRLADREKYRNLVQRAKSIILRIDMAGEIVFSNEYAEQFYGYESGELIGKPLIGTLIPKKDMEGQSMKRYLGRLLKNPAAHPFNEMMNIRKNGEIVWVSWANDSVLAGNNTMVGLLCIGTDITDRKLMEEALRQREKQYRLLAENVTDVIWGLDADLRFTYISPSDEMVRGYKRYDVLGRFLDEFLTPVSRMRFSEILRVLEEQAENPEQPPSATEALEFLCADGSTVWLECHLGVLLNEDGDKLGIQGVGRDITDRKLAEALREDVERMARHDLKTPLGAVIGLPGEIRRLGELNDDQDAMLDTIADAGETMLQLINRSLDLYKMERGTYVLTKTKVDLLRMLERIKAEAMPQIRGKGISVGIEVQPNGRADSFMATVDKELCRSMISNLVVNALQASPESGSVSIVLKKTDVLSLIIRNQGEVASALRDIFFDKYSTANTPGGSGLGTYSARLIARTHGGDIVVETHVSGQTSVVVTLPI
ncbi:PAS domain S-box protein [Pseudodesulfovibrio sp. JC047]|uniref:PAS domain S-box protein n=1 Tax=Pseudodesulfovibrio sp. JC047 TaxID=2683199 RepID=UPI0013D51C90|nr:PAS domain S-box protein [Pseudodesulfovibrio sp. JC047]NDV20131.1 PAS domain S-box protein [Pseudodesulfovibrio sp. JC047]